MYRYLLLVAIATAWLGLAAPAESQESEFSAPARLGSPSDRPSAPSEQPSNAPRLRAPVLVPPTYVPPAFVPPSFVTPAQTYPDSGPALQAPSGAGAMAPHPDLTHETPFAVDFKDGVGFKTIDGLFSMKINALLQIDYRDFTHTAGDLYTGNSLHDNFVLPRIRLFFRGNVTEFMDYAVSLTTGVSPNAPGNVPAPTNLLDAYVDLNPFGSECKEQFQIRIGRFKTPYTYQFYKISPQDFTTPELSMFTTNFLQNWETGVMAHGLLLEKRFEYAAGVFNGVPNSFEVPQNDRQGIFYGALSPFLLQEQSLLKRLTVAASYAVGYQNGNALPGALGTAAASNGPPDNLLLSPTFLQFNSDARQTGFHDLFALDVIWSYKSFNFYGEYNCGRQTYGLASAPAKTVPVSLSGYSGAVTYFFTGEEISPTRARVKPLQPYNWAARTWGAFEGFGRFSNLVLDSDVLHNGLLVPGANANQVNATDIGCHWYLNEYVKFTFDWQHAMFNQPISTAPGNSSAKTINTEDLLWLRFQLYY